MKIIKKSTFVAVLIILLGITATALMVAFGDNDKEQVLDVSPLSVKTMRLKKSDYQIKIPAWGNVAPQEFVDICAEITGHVTKVSRNLYVGNRVQENEFLFSLDDRNYLNRLAEAKGETVLAIQKFEIEKGRQIVARKEWELLEKSTWNGSSNKLLALRVPQLKTQEAVVQIAKARESQAALDVERTQIKSPCSGIILSENIALGQLLSSGSAGVRIGCSKKYQITAFFSPGNPVNPGQREVTIITDEREFSGKIKSISPVISKETRQKQALIEFEGTEIPIGGYARLLLPGVSYEKVIIVPRSAIRSDDSVWVFSKTSTLEIRNVDILGEDKENVVIGAGVSEDDRIVLSQIANPLVGMQLSQLQQINANE